jgi:hypothetical protein
MISYEGMKNQSNAMDHSLGNSERFFDWNHESGVESRMKRASFRVTIGAFAIGRNRAIHNLPLIELKRDGGVHLTFPEGATPTDGEVYRIVRPIGFYGDDYSSLGHLRKTVAKVKILGVSGSNRVEVQVLRGSVVGGVSAEKD